MPPPPRPCRPGASVRAAPACAPPPRPDQGPGRAGAGRGWDGPAPRRWRGVLWSIRRCSAQSRRASGPPCCPSAGLMSPDDGDSHHRVCRVGGSRPIGQALLPHPAFSSATAPCLPRVPVAPSGRHLTPRAPRPGPVEPRRATAPIRLRGHAPMARHASRLHIHRPRRHAEASCLTMPFVGESTRAGLEWRTRSSVLTDLG